MFDSELETAPLRRPQKILVGVVTAVLLVTTGTMVSFSLRRPQVETFAPTPIGTREAGERLVGPVTYTVDAADEDEWRYFDFSRGSVVQAPGPLDWDLAFRRYHLIVNGGVAFPGGGGVRDLGVVAFDSVKELPAGGYDGNDAGADTANAVTDHWYRYSFTSHLLRPSGRVFAVRTADGRHAKLTIVSYYCLGAEPGCVTFRYVYQGDGSRRVVPAGAAEPSPPSTGESR